MAHSDLKRSTALALTLLLAAAGLTAAARAEGSPIKELKDARPEGTVIISNLSGSVDVSVWERSEIEITGTLGKGSERLKFEVDGDQARIEVVLPSRARNVDGSELVLRVPAGSSLEIETVSADVRVAGVLGRLEIETVSGDLAVAGKPRAIDLETVSGDADLTVETRELAVETVSGDLKVAAGGVVRAEVEAVSGNVLFGGTLAPDAVVQLQSFSGQVQLALPAEADARIQMETFSGTIDNRLSDEGGSSGGRGGSRELTVGSGGARISIETFSGQIVLARS